MEGNSNLLVKHNKRIGTSSCGRPVDSWKLGNPATGSRESHLTIGNIWSTIDCHFIVTDVSLST